MNIVIEEYVPNGKENGIIPIIPWKWTVYQGSKIMTYGYTHTQEQAEEASNRALKAYNIK